VESLVVEVRAGVRPGTGEVLQGGPEADFVGFGEPGVLVGPVMEFVVDPGEEGDWGVAEGEVDSSGL